MMKRQMCNIIFTVNCGGKQRNYICTTFILLFLLSLFSFLKKTNKMKKESLIKNKERK